MPIEHFEEICSSYLVTKEADLLTLSAYLHQLGSLLHFQNDSSLKTMYS
ncbi:MAG: COR domain-containing protein [Saprospiraceae bacterium]